MIVTSLPETLLNNNTYLSLTTGILNSLTGVGNGPVKLASIEGNCVGTANTQYFLQVVDAIPPVNPPMYSVPIIGGLAFSFVYPDGLSTEKMSNGAVHGENTIAPYLAISKTDSLYTAVTDGATATVNVTLEQQTVLPTNASLSSAANVGNLAIFLDPNPAKRLCYLLAYNNTGASGYLMLFAKSTYANGQYPIRQWPVAAGATLVLNYSAEGIPVSQIDSDGTLHTGCYVVGSSTTGTLTTVANGWSFSAWNI